MSNYWINESISLAKERNYLDLLFRVYPVATRRDPREINNGVWENIHTFYTNHDYSNLLKELFKLEKFPFDNAYVAFLKADHTAIERNPETIDRLGAFICNDMTIDEIYTGITAPKSTSRSMGPMFKNWLLLHPFGNTFINKYDYPSFLSTQNAILIGGDDFLKRFCQRYFGYTRNKGIDFIAKVGKNFIIGETKFITAAGGTQDKSYKDIESLLQCQFISSIPNTNVIAIGILDGYPLLNQGHYIRDFQNNNFPILSALLLRDYLFSLLHENETI